MNYFTVFLAGVATSFTPCVYPLIPIIVGVIGSAKENSSRRNFILSFTYVLGVALTFSSLGLVAALTGKVFGQIQTSPWAHLIVGCIIILFALALLDVITLPSFFLSRIGAGKVKKGGSLASVFLMGVTSGFVVAPCTTAVLGTVLAYVASKQNLVFGFTLLFTFALGLGTLLVVIGTFTGVLKILPKSDKWMGVVQKGIAWAMIALGGYFIFKAWSLR